MPQNNLQSRELTVNQSEDSTGNQSERSPELQKQLDCKAKGGRWDALNKVCIMPPPKVPEIKAPKEKNDPVTKRVITATGEDITNLTEEEKARKLRESRGLKGDFELAPKQAQDMNEFGVFTDQPSGKLGGLIDRDRSVFGLTPEETVKKITDEAEQRELPIGGQAEAVLERQRQQLQTQGFEVAQLGGGVSQDILDELRGGITVEDASLWKAFKSSLPDAVIDAIGGGLSWASVGAGVGGTVGGVATKTPAGIAAGASGGAITAAKIGAVVSGIKSILSNVVSDYERQQSEIIETPIRSLSETKPRINDIINNQNANPYELEANREKFWTMIHFLDLEWERLKETTDDPQNDFLGDQGINQLQEYEVFNIKNGERQGMIDDWNLAVLNPDPARIRPTTITLKELEKWTAENLK